MRPRKAMKVLSPSDSSDDEPLSRKLSKRKIQETQTAQNNDSSSESDIENYLQPANEIDLNLPFFNNDQSSTLKNPENTNGKLGDSDFDSDTGEMDNNPESSQATASVSNFHFEQLQQYSKKMDEMKRCAEEYKTRKQAENMQVNITNLLAAGEAKPTKEDIFAELDVSLHSSDYESCSESEKEGWEEVNEKQKEENVVPKESLQIIVDMPGPIRKKKGVDLMASIKRRINRIKKENQVFIHKVHLLCWIAHGNYVSSIISSPQLLAVGLSLVPEDCYRPAKRVDLNYLEQVLKWYHNFINTVEMVVPQDQNLHDLLQTQIEKKEAYDKNMLVYIFIILLRSMGIQCRLVLSFQVEPLRPPDSELISLSTKNQLKAGPSKIKSKDQSSIQDNETDKSELTAKNREKKPRSKSVNENSEITVEDSKKTRSKSTSTIKPVDNRKGKSKKKNENSEPAVEVAKTRSKSTSENNNKLKLNENKKVRSLSATDATTKLRLKKNKTEISKSPSSQEISANTRTLRSHKKSIPQIDGADDSSSEEEVLLQVDGAIDTESSTSSKPDANNKCPKRHSKRLSIKIPKYGDTDSEDEFTTRSPLANRSLSQVNGSPKVVKNESRPSLQTNGVNERNKHKLPRKKVAQKSADLKKTKNKPSPKKRRSGHESEEDSDYVPEVPQKKRRESADDFSPKTKSPTRRGQTKKGGSDDKIKKKTQGTDIWVEVFVESVKKWISVDVVKGQVNCVNELHTRATQPVCYVVAWDNRSQLKDVTGRYCQNFNTLTRKLRVGTKWWDEALRPFVVPKTPRDKAEDEEISKQQLEKPLPKTIGEYKNHPLYVLKRHLLKFEAIYPPDPPILGFIRNEPVYSRQCVYTLRSRDTWLKHAKVVKLGEQPYKVVIMPRYDKLSHSIVMDRMLDIFGPWQIEDYAPPTAENGVVPRNAFGNVDLFQPSMLPKKTVHLKLPGLNKVAKKMNVDCASAIVGFDFHGGWCHPVYDGYVVCEEYANALEAAWELEQDEIEKREQDKIDKRVYGNWKRLIKGLLIRERLKAKYEFGAVPEEKNKKKTKGAPKFATKKKCRNRIMCICHIPVSLSSVFTFYGYNHLY